jgi:antitoxin MazE
MQVIKWGDSLALLFPEELSRRLGLREGDTLHAEIAADDSLILRPSRQRRAEFVAELNAARDALPMGASVIDELRREPRY